MKKKKKFKKKLGAIEESVKTGKTNTFFVDYNKTAFASQILWCSKEHNIEDVEPYIDFIRCDDGEGYQFLNSIDNDFDVLSVNHFGAIETGEEDVYFLCYTADLVIDLEKYPKFQLALEYSNYEVEVVLGFKMDGVSLEDRRGRSSHFEERDNRTTKLQKF